MIDTTGYRHRIPVQIRFSDIDRLNHVNNACYHNYIELGRVKYFGKVLDTFVNWGEQGFILARTEIDHTAPLFPEDEVYCYTRISKIGNKSITMNSLITRRKNEAEEICAAVTGILVAMNYKKDESMSVPDSWRAAIRKFEGDV